MRSTAAQPTTAALGTRFCTSSYVSGMRRDTIEREEFIELLDGKTEEEVFGDRVEPAPPPVPRLRAAV